MVNTFQELIVYQRAYAIALAIHKRSLEFPRIEQYALADQMRRASKSVCANIAEGFARHHGSAAEFRRFTNIASGSSDEMAVWIKFSDDLAYIDKEEAQEWTQEYAEISKMLFSLSKNWKTTKHS